MTETDENPMSSSRFLNAVFDLSDFSNFINGRPGKISFIRLGSVLASKVLTWLTEF